MNGNATEEPPKTRILIVDDHASMREGIALFLNLQPNLHACCEAANAEAALTAMSICTHQLAIVDISLNGDSGLSLIRLMKSRYPSLAILAFSMHEEYLFAERALQAGANGYLMKLEGFKQILLALQQIMTGQTYLSRAMHDRLKLAAAPLAVQHDLLARLTEREFEILHLIGQGFGSRQIAEQLNRSIKTIDNHRANLKDKLHLECGRDLERFAAQWLGAN